MDVKCAKCEFEYSLDETLVGAGGTSVRCTNCGHVFKVFRRTGSGMDTWILRRKDGETTPFEHLGVLQGWILAEEVSEDDEISRAGKEWKRLGDFSEMKSFFAEAHKAAEVRASLAPVSPKGVRPARIESFSTPPPPRKAKPGGEPSKPATQTSPDSPSPARTGRSKATWIAAAVVVAGIAIAAWFAVSGSQDRGKLATEEQGEAPAVAEQEKVRPLVSPTPEAPVAAPAPKPDAGVAARPEPPPEPVPAPAPPEPPPVAPAPAPKPAAPHASPAAPASQGKPTPSAPVAPAANSTDALLEQASASKAGGNITEAMALFQKVLTKQPSNVDALSGLGSCYLDKGSYGQAAASFRKVLAISPSNGPAVLGLAEALKAQGQKQEALALYKRYLSENPTGRGAATARSNVAKLEAALGLSAPAPAGETPSAEGKPTD
ncbi:MAG: tetratricopeptide repeat protein [Deltaproteobacteria bacterium]|nr:tetratricopeptide repeat protein [Deltaproteobacteria bacterium]